MILDILALASATALWAGGSWPPISEGSARPGAQVAYGLEARIWLQHGDEPVLHGGARERVYYRVSEDAYVAVLQIDTNGRVRLLFPSGPYEDPFVQGGPSYRLFVRRSPYWYVENEPGIGYFFIIASPQPLDFSVFRFSEYEDEWDLGLVRTRVSGDPYVVMEDFVEYLVPDWQYGDYALDFAAYHVGQAYQYPRFLCYDCHGFRPFGLWDPYAHTCLRFRVVIYDDPYYYPVYRYRGTRVVYVRPPAARQPRFVFKERARGEAGTPLVRSRPGVAVPAAPAAPAVRRRVGGGVASPAPVESPVPEVDVPGPGGGARAPELAPGARPRAGGAVGQPSPERAERPGGGEARPLSPGFRPVRGPDEAARVGPQRGTPAAAQPPAREVEWSAARQGSDRTRALPQVLRKAQAREEDPQERPKLERRPPPETRPAPQRPAVKPMLPSEKPRERSEPPARPSARPAKPSPPPRESKPPPVSRGAVQGGPRTAWSRAGEVVPRPGAS